MNTAKLRDFAPAARKGLIASITAKALRFGIRPGKPIPRPTPEGEFVRIEGVLHPRSVLSLFNDLAAKVAKHGFDHVVEEAAYTWFNRLAAIRYMEVHGYLSHGLRALSDPNGATLPEILQQAQSVEIDGLDRKAVLELLTLGNRQEELFQLLLRAQCHALSNAMPFLFDRIDGATELLTPDNLLSPSSIVRQIVSEIPEDDWRTTEILGWLYQFYVSEEKARVDGLVKKGQAVAPEDIPAKTQLFTPNWIVQFLVQNSLGRLWMDVYPGSPLRDQMPYYTPPAEQTPEVAAQLAAITPKYLDPTELTAIDPAAGSGHILLELYNLFFAMYREHGTLPSDIPRLIVERNLFGLELDRRAAQIAGFAVLMRARADDPTILSPLPSEGEGAGVRAVKLNVHPIRHSRDLDLSVLLGERKPEPIVPDRHLFEDEAPQPKLIASGKPLISDAVTLRELVELFRDADIEGSLIRVPASLLGRLDRLEAEVQGHLAKSDLLTGSALDELRDLIGQARLLARRFTTCVANPPYLGGKAMAKELKDFAKAEYPNTKSDLFAMFLERGFDFAEPNGFNAMVTMQSWMFLSSYESFRKEIIENRTISAMAHLGARGFQELKGEVVQTTATVFRATRSEHHAGVYHRVIDGDEAAKAEAIRVQSARWDSLAQSEFKKIPGWPIAYWLSDAAIRCFSDLPKLGAISPTKIGMRTGNNSRFLRYWWEVSNTDLGLAFESASSAAKSNTKWFPYNKGGEYRKWYGNQEVVVYWHRDGEEIKAETRRKYPQLGENLGWKISNEEFYFRPGLTWTFISSGGFGIRYSPEGFLFDVAGSSTFPPTQKLHEILAFLCSTSALYFLRALNPTLNFQVENVASLPLPSFDPSVSKRLDSLAKQAIEISRGDWNCFELSLDYQVAPFLIDLTNDVRSAWSAIQNRASTHVATQTAIETEISEIVADFLGISIEVERSVQELPVSLRQNPCHGVRSKELTDLNDSDEVDECADSTVANSLSRNSLQESFTSRHFKELISFVVGNMMGRYSLDEPGLIYAHAGNEGFDPSRYRTFPADADGILPITDDLYFGDEDTAERLAKWVRTVWPNSPLEENLAFIADSLYAEDAGRKPEETPLEAIRRYLVNDFYRDHQQTYKNRPIYWMFNSGKKKAFQALVYLHRYTPNTLSRMRSEYVQPLLGQLQSRLNDSSVKEQAATSTASKKAQSRLTKKLSDQYEELLAFEQRLNYYALQAIALDLDDGVKVNYGKFHDPKIGPILAEEKKITGGKDD